MLFDKNKKDILSKLDKSNKKAIDSDIGALVELLNSMEDYFTTSSCSGRILLIENMLGSKKEARFVFSSHSVASFSVIKNALSNIANDLWFKQESVIIHICCRDMGSAGRLLGIVRDLGMKRAGIISISKKIVIEVVGTESMETIIAKDGKLLVDDNYLKELVNEANKKLIRNKKKIDELYKKIITFSLL